MDWELIGKTLGGAAAGFSAVSFVLNKIGIWKFTVGKREKGSSNGNGWHKCPFYSSHIDRSEKTHGALHISEEALSKLNEIKTNLKEANFLTEGTHDRICRANLSELKGEIRDMIDKRLQEAENRIIAVVRNGG